MVARHKTRFHLTLPNPTDRQALGITLNMALYGATKDGTNTVTVEEIVDNDNSADSAEIIRKATARLNSQKK